MKDFKNESALFADPNAYIMGVKKESKKVVFCEPYECLPSYYPNNNFKKGECECVPKLRPTKDCDHEKKCNHINKKSSGFDFQSLMPILSLLGGGGGLDLSKITSILGEKQLGQNSISLISSLMQNGGGFENILNMFKPKQSKSKSQIKSSDVEIINYTRVE